MKYALEQRLRLLDFIADHFGTVRREYLCDYFGISIPQATKDIKEYMRIAPDNIRYSHTLKTYVKNPEFSRVFP
jgi:hypothetical protein